MLVGTAVNLKMQAPMYDSTVSILIEPKDPNIMSSKVEEVYAPSDMAIDYYKTQYEILRSHKIMRETAHRLKLNTYPEYRFVAAIHPESEAERALVKALRTHIKVSPVANSRIVNITVESIDPHLAADIANTLAAVYIAQDVEMKASATGEASQLITGPVEDLRQKVEASERALYEFASQHGLVNVDERRRLATQKLADLNAQMMTAQAKRVEAESRFKQSSDHTKDNESSPEVLASVLIQNLRNEEIQAAQKVADAKEKYGIKHPAMGQALSDLKELQARIQSEIEKVYSALNAEYEVALARENAIKKAMAQQTAAVLAMGQPEMDYGILMREVESNKQLYNLFLKRMKETAIGTNIHTSNIFVADPAIVSMVPARPKMLQAMALAGLLGLVGGFCVAFFLEQLNTTLRSPPDIAQYLPGVPYLGFLPALDAKHKIDLTTSESPHSLFAENVRSIRTNLILSSPTESPRSILITSPRANEGKSMFSVNLAIALAQLGHETVLIDADFRKPRLHKVFNLEVGYGLSEYLASGEGLEDIIKQTPIAKLRFIPCGTIPANPVELLQSAPMANLLNSLKQDDGYVIVDSSPLIGLSDPVVLATMVDGVVLVVWAGHTGRHEAALAARQLIEGKSRVLGTVLQAVDSREMSLYYSHYYPCYHYQENGKLI